jgi:uncharacterized protein
MGALVMPGLQVPALYEAEVTHLRRSPITNSFRYGTGYWLVDFDQIADPPRWLRFLARIEASDHTDVRRFLSERDIPAQRILMLAAARTLGHVFNPISMFWCYNHAGALTAVLAEVCNTYGGRHVYVLDLDDGGRAVTAKAMYVSPFYPVDGEYRIRVGEPGARLSMSIVLERDGDHPFVATMSGTRRPFTWLNVVRLALRYPAARTSWLIRWQGLRLWRRGLEVQAR